MTHKKVMVHVLGCHLQAELKGMDWRALVIGQPLSLLGRGVQGLNQAARLESSVLSFGTGASMQDGFSEAEFTQKRLLESLGDISELLKETLGWDPMPKLKSSLEEARLDFVSQNTVGELELLFGHCLDFGINTIYLVTNDFHAARCMNVANAAKRAIPGADQLTVLLVACGDGTVPAVVVEESHRGDMPKTPYRGLVSRIFKVPSASSGRFQKEFLELLERYGA